LHSYHRPLEEYARDIALDLDKLHLNGVIVKESPRKRNFELLSSRYSVGWVMDLHSDPYHTPPEKSDLISPYNPLAIIYYGEIWPKGGPSTTPIGWTSPRSRGVKKLLSEFREKYYPSACLYIEPSSISAIPRFLHIGLLWYRPKQISLELLKNLTNHLHSYPL